MLLQTHANLEETLIELLAAKPQAKVHELQRKLGLRGRRYTFQALYKSLAKLQEEGVVVKVGSNYSLKLSWALDLVSLAQKISRIHLDPSASRMSLPAPGKSLRFHFTSLAKTDDFWAHLLIRLFQHCRAKIAYEWLPHPWFELLHREKEDKFREILRRNSCRLVIIVGGDTFLDRHCTKRWDKSMYRYSFAESPFHRRRTEYIDVVEDFVLTLKLSPQLSSELDDYFDSVESADDFKALRFLRIMSQSTKSQIKLENSAMKAKRLRRLFVEYFY